MLSSSSSCSSQDKLYQRIYDELMCFLKNIKLQMNGTKCESMTFCLNKTNINKMKIKGKIN